MFGALSRRYASSVSKEAYYQQCKQDPYCRMAVNDKYRSRSAYKLIQLNEKYQVIKPGYTIIDLGCRPGGWCQVASSIVGKSGRIGGIDILPMQPLPNVKFIQGNVLDEDGKTLSKLISWIYENGGGRAVDTILSDMSPNLSGISLRDQANCLKVMDFALDFSIKIFSSKGKSKSASTIESESECASTSESDTKASSSIDSNVILNSKSLVCKVFMGENFDLFRNRVKQHYKRVDIFKPPCSKKESAEVYLIGRKFILNTNQKNRE